MPRFTLVIISFWYFSLSIDAQDITPPDVAQLAAEQQSALVESRRAAEERERLKLENSQITTEGESLSGTSLTPTNPDGFKILFTNITIDGHSLLDPLFVESIQLRYQNSELGMEEVNNILRELTNEYVRLGYITCRAYLPEQDIVSGKLIVKCVEGELEKFSGAAKPSELYVITAFPGLEGNILNLRDLEQGIDQLNRLPSNDAKMDIEPGENFGGSIVNLTNNQKKRWRIIQSFDNASLPSVGEYQTRTTFQYDNGFELNDQWSASYGRDLSSRDDGNFSESASVSASIPYGYWLFNASASYFTYLSEVAIPAFDLSSSGTTWNFNLGGSYLFHRDQHTKSTFHFGLNYAVIENFLNDLKLEVSSRQVMLANIGVSHQRPIKGGSFYTMLDFSHSLPILNSFSDSDRVNDEQPEPLFGILSWDNHYSRRMSIPGFAENQGLWSSNFKIQYSPETLFSAQQLSLGGNHSIRGFKEESILFNSGSYWRNDITQPLFSLAQTTNSVVGTVSGYVAYDVGILFGQGRDQEIQGLIQGSAVGLKFSEGFINGDLSVGIPIDAPDFIENRSAVFHAALNFTF